MLARSADGTTDALLVAHGFDFALMARLVRERLATATPERVYAGGKPVEVTPGADHGCGPAGAGGRGMNRPVGKHRLRVAYCN